jgi:hypothetical protein
MSFNDRDIQLLWLSILWRYFIYTFALQFLLSILVGIFHGPSFHQLFSNHRSLMFGFDGAWHGIASIVSLKQSLLVHKWGK